MKRLLCLFFLLLTACSQQPVIIHPPIIETKALPPPIGSLSTKDGSTLLALDMASSTLALPVKPSEIDPLTDYIHRFQTDGVMFDYVQTVKQKRGRLCNKISVFYNGAPNSSTVLSQLAENYSYSCPCVVASYIQFMEAGMADSPQMAQVETDCQRLY